VITTEPKPKMPKKSPQRRALRVLLVLGLLLFLAFNALAFLHARSITHYAPTDIRSTRLREVRTTLDKARLLILGPSIRRMANTKTPAELRLPFEDRSFPNRRGQRLAAWRIPGRPGQPTVLMFPGYGGSRDTLLRAAAEFHAAGCEAWLVDFSGVGDSDGRMATLGWREAEDVAAAMRAVQAERKGPVIFYGTSMGAVAILTAQYRGLATPDAMILECPFDRLSGTLGNRLAMIGIPRAPLAQGIAFWIGAQHGFNGLAHDPVNYARRVRCPVLFLQGENDTLVGRDAALAYARVFGNRATFQLFPKAGHAWLIRDAPELWRKSVRDFLAQRLSAKEFSTVAR
jgi:pimeloyl-ACP methyl ester carboxylesterase